MLRMNWWETSEPSSHLGMGTPNPPVRLTQEQSFHAAGYDGERIGRCHSVVVTCIGRATSRADRRALSSRKPLRTTSSLSELRGVAGYNQARTESVPAPETRMNVIVGLSLAKLLAPEIVRIVCHAPIRLLVHPCCGDAEAEKHASWPDSLPSIAARSEGLF